MISWRDLTSATVFLALGLVAVPGGARADGVYFTTPSVFRITIKKFEICADAVCSDPVVLGSGDAVFDIASAASGADVGAYAGNAAIPRGVTYKYARLTYGRTFSLSGAVHVPDVGSGAPANMAAAACYTKTGNSTSGLAETVTTSTDTQTNLAAAQAAASPQEIYLQEGPPPEGDAMVSEVYSADSVVGVFTMPRSLLLTSESAAPEIVLSIDAHNAMSFQADGTSCYADEEPPTISLTVTQ